MTFKKPTRAGQTGLAIGALLGIALAMFASGYAFAETPAAAPPTPPRAHLNKGDTAWMLTSTRARSVDDHSRPGAVLRRPGPLQEHALGADAGVLHGLHRHHHLGAVRLQPRLHRRLRRFIGGFDKIFLQGITTDSQAATFSVGVDIPELHLRLLPDDLRGDHPGADRRRLRRAHEVLRDGAVHAAVGHVHLLPDRPHGLVLGRPGRDRRRRQGPRRRDRRRRQDRRAGQARRGDGRRRPGLQVGRHRLRRRHRRAHQLPASPVWSARSWSASASASARS